MAIRRAVVYYSRVPGLPSHLVQELNVSTLGVYFHMNFMLTQKHSDPKTMYTSCMLYKFLSMLMEEPSFRSFNII